MGVPDNLWVSAWLSSTARPGQAGNAVIAGHRGIGAPGLFGRLEKLKTGDRIHVSNAGHAELVYEVTRVASLDLSADTQMQVFGPTTQQQLVLITCYGRYSRTTGTYDHRLVVFSRLLPASA
jgi:LPXTG-site transpeptidase (sortase) family protein